MTPVDTPTTIQHFNVWRCLNRKIYQTSLTVENLIRNGNESYLDMVFELEKNGINHDWVEREIRQKVMFLEKGGKKYILPAYMSKHLPLMPKEGFDCYLKKSDTTVYRFITKPDVSKIIGTKTKSFKEVIAAWNPVKHTSPRSRDFLAIQSIASLAKGGKYRLCSRPESAKNAFDTILGMITNDVVNVSKPTLAKLETLFYYHHKVIPDEITSLQGTNVREIEPFFLKLADESPTMTKHSMAQKKDLNEIDLTMSSCIFTYNTVEDVAEDSKFFDDVWQNINAFNSRYPAFLVYGVVDESLPKLNMSQAQRILDRNMEFIRELAKNILYYIQNMSDELHFYDRSKFCLIRRQRVNVECILDALDVYCESQDEYDDWLLWMNDSIGKYKEMVHSRKNPIIKKEENQQTEMVTEDIFDDDMFGDTK